MDEQVGEIPLEGGWQTAVRRAGDVVYRSAGPQSRSVIALLAHLERAGFDDAPRVVGSGFAPDGREQLAFVRGSSPHPRPWSDEAAWQLGAKTRMLHEATASFVPPPDVHWRRWFARDLPSDTQVIGHGDLGPWNILAVDSMPVAFIDWDNAGPVGAIWEVAQLVWLNAQLHDDDVAAMNELPEAATRCRQARWILDGYRMASADRANVVDAMIELAIRSAREEAVLYRVEPDSASPAPDGFPVLWGVTWRARAAAWMLDHRRQLLTALM